MKKKEDHSVKVTGSELLFLVSELEKLPSLIDKIQEVVKPKENDKEFNNALTVIYERRDFIRRDLQLRYKHYYNESLKKSNQ